MHEWPNVFTEEQLLTHYVNIVKREVLAQFKDVTQDVIPHVHKMWPKVFTLFCNNNSDNTYEYVVLFSTQLDPIKNPIFWLAADINQ